MNNEEEKIMIEEPQQIDANITPNVDPVAPVVNQTPAQPIETNTTNPNEVVPVTYENPNMAEQNTEIVVNPVTLKVESKPVETPVSSEPTSVEPVKVEEKVELKDGPKWKRVMVFIFFILMFAFVMGMPYINEYIEKLTAKEGLSPIERRARALEEEQKRKEEEEKNANKQEEYKTLTCNSITEQLTDYMKDIEQTFEYNSKNEIVKSSIKTTYTFQTINESYTTLKTKCDQDGLKYIDKAGYEPGCSYNDTEVIIEKTFDLEIFKSIQDGTELIDSNAKYKDKTDDIKKELTNQGYTCN